MATAMGGPPDYPIQVTFDTQQRVNRLWGIPLLGWSIRFLALIPHFVVLWLLGVFVGLSYLVSWVPVLVFGHQAEILVQLYTTTYRYTARVYAWAVFLAGPYPPIIPGVEPYPVNLDFAAGDRSINRLWGIPFLGIYLRAILVIPHVLILVVLSILMALLAVVLWIPILINGRAPGLAYTIFGGYIRLAARVGMYVLLMPVSWPPLGV